MMEPAIERSAPIRAADVILAAAVRGAADTAYIEPVPMADDTLVITLEKDGRVIGTSTVDIALGAATIARLGFLARLDLTSANTVTGVIPAKSGDKEADVVVTIRGGSSGLRCELLIVRRGVAPAAKVGPVELKPGDVVDRYEIVQWLGQGGMGAVYRVRHSTLGREHALKVLRKNIVDSDATAAMRFLREARAASRIRHPSIVDVYDFGHLADGRPYFVMELLSGKSLADLIDAGDLDPARVVSIAKQLAEALAAAHERGVVHADITPSNALVVDDGSGAGQRVKLVDFGLAELVGEELTREDTAYIFGTPHYVSPEQIRGMPATERTDQYGLGAVLFEMLTDRPPFQDNDIRALCMKHIQAPIPEPISKFGPLPPKLIDIVMTLLQKSPSGRFPNMRALIVALDEVERVIDRRGWRRWLPR
jgi:tRNA A-37 threonylcarbamoyl transferase component Bud32